MGIGRQLRQAREAHGLTVRDISEITKIATRQIDAIETEHYEKLPGGIFGRGYVRAVAVVLKMDPDAAVEAYRDETEADRTTVLLPPAGSSASAGEHLGRTAGYVSMSWRDDRLEPRMRLAPMDGAPTHPGPGSRVVAAILLGLGVILLILWLGRERTGGPVSDAGPAGSGSLPGSVTVAPAQPVGTSGRQPAPASHGQTALDIQLAATRACWVVLTVDGERVIYRMLQAGDDARATVRDRAVLRTGDAGALRIGFGGAEPRPVGPSGAVRTIEFTPSTYRAAFAP